MRSIKITPIYNEGLVKVKEKGKKPYYVSLPMIDKYRKFSLSIMKELCEHLFDEVEYVKEINPDIYNFLIPIENINIPTELLNLMSKRNIKLKNVALKVSRPKQRIIENYELLRKVNFWIIFYYRGKSWLTSIITWDKRGLEDLEKIREIGKELTSKLLEIYNYGYLLKLRKELNEESIMELLNKYFPLKKIEVEEKESEKVKEVKMVEEKVERRVERKIKSGEKARKVKRRKREKIQKKEVPYEIVESEVEKFLRSEPINFFDRVVKSKIEQIKIEELDENQRKELYKLVYEYVCSRNAEAQRKFVREVNLKFINLPYETYYK